MADPEHIKWLLEGVESWNKRRENKRSKGEYFRPDFSDVAFNSEFAKAGQDISIDQRTPLANVDLAFANLTGARLECADLRTANLFRADLTKARLDGADLTCADLDEANLTNASLNSAILKHTILIDAILTGTKFTSAEPWKAFIYSNKRTVPKPNQVQQTTITAIGRLLKAIEDYEKYYGEIESKIGHSEEFAFYFRGEPTCGWELRPSVMRTDSNKRGNSERDMLRDLISRRPSEFSGMTPALAQWMLAQHHGLPTRFLDVTRNPLVALFFACEEDEQHDGILHIFAVSRSLIKPFESDAVSVIANFAKLSSEEQDLILGKCIPQSRLHSSQPVSHRDYSEAMRRLYQLIRVEKAYFDQRIDPRDLYRVLVVEPQQSSDRIRAQSGAFIASAFHERFERDKILVWNSNIPVYAHYMLTVPSSHKSSLLKELRLLNITRETLFPGLDASAMAVKNSHLNRGAT